MSFNIRYDNPDDDDNAWPHRKEYVAKLILTNDDLIGTQEGLINQLEDLDELLFQDKQVRYDRVGISWDGYEDKGDFVQFTSARIDTNYSLMILFGFRKAPIIQAKKGETLLLIRFLR